MYFKPGCTRVENPGEWVPQVYAKLPWGVKAFKKYWEGGSPILGFIAFSLTSCLKFTWGAHIVTPPFPPHPPVFI